MKQPVLISMLIALVCAGCATSADMSYAFRTNSVECTQLSREIAQQKGDSSRRKSLNQKYYQDCVGK